MTSNFKTVTVRDPAFLKWLRGLPCCMKGRHNIACDGDIMGCHYRLGSHAGKGQKPSDRRATPMCFAHHNLQHNMGELSFWGRVHPMWLIERLDFCYPDIETATMMVQKFQRM